MAEIREKRAKVRRARPQKDNIIITIVTVLILLTPVILLVNLFQINHIQGEIENLKHENEILKSQIEQSSSESIIQMDDRLKKIETIYEDVSRGSADRSDSMLVPQIDTSQKNLYGLSNNSCWHSTRFTAGSVD